MESIQSNKRLSNEKLRSMTARICKKMSGTQDGFFPAKAKYDTETFNKFCGIISANECLEHFLTFFSVGGHPMEGFLGRLLYEVSFEMLEETISSMSKVESAELTRFKKQARHDQLTIEKLRKKEKNQRDEINRLNERNKKLTIEMINYKTQATKVDENYSSEIIKAAEKVATLQTKIENLTRVNEAAKLEVTNLNNQLAEIEENNQHLKTQIESSQLANSVDKSVIARNLIKELTILIKNELGEPDSDTTSTFEFDELKKKFTELKECQICNEDFDDTARKPVTIKCGHIYCKSCMILLSNSTRKCPSCRASFRKEDLISLNLNFGGLRL